MNINVKMNMKDTIDGINRVQKIRIDDFFPEQLAADCTAYNQGLDKIRARLSALAKMASESLDKAISGNFKSSSAASSIEKLHKELLAIKLEALAHLSKKEGFGEGYASAHNSERTRLREAAAQRSEEIRAECQKQGMAEVAIRFAISHDEKRRDLAVAAQSGFVSELVSSQESEFISALRNSIKAAFYL